MRTLLALTLLSTMAVWGNDEVIDRFDKENLDQGQNVARVTLADEGALIRRDGVSETEPMVRNMPVVSGDFVQTRNRAFAEIELLDGSLIQISDQTELEFQAVNEPWEGGSMTLARLHDGSLFLHTTETVDSARRLVRVDTESGSAYVEAPGIYRIDLSRGKMTLRTYRGFAELSGEEDSVAVYSGEMAVIRNMQRPSAAKPFNSFRSDEFERWAYERRPVSAVSAKYVDNSLSSYARDLDDNGSWRYDDQVNTHVWVPYVDAEWAPYRRGYWGYCGPSLTWISYDPFGYLTHHYGRWMWRASIGWYWVPGRYYSPAWVAWNYHDSYVGWCALGYYDEPWYYSTGYHGPSVRVRTTVVVNNYWNYVPAVAIVNRRRNYDTLHLNINGARRITTRPIYIKREDYGKPDRLVEALRDPTVNRRRAEARAATAGTILASGNRTNSRTSPQRVRIADRNTGTSAPSRLTTVSRRDTGSAAAVSRRINDARRDETPNRVDGLSRGIDGADRAAGRVTGSRNTTRVERSNGTTTRSDAVRTDSRAVRTERSPIKQGDSGAAASRTGNSSRTTVTRSSNSSRSSAPRIGNSSRSTATRSDNGSRATSSHSGSSSRSTATRNTGRTGSRNSTATRSSGSSSRNTSSATRSSGSSSRNTSSATRSSGSSSRNTGSATRSSGGNVSRNNTTTTSTRKHD